MLKNAHAHAHAIHAIHAHAIHAHAMRISHVLLSLSPLINIYVLYCTVLSCNPTLIMGGGGGGTIDICFRLSLFHHNLS